MLISPILNVSHQQTCLMSFANILTLVIMTQTALDHFANDPLSVQGDSLFVCLSKCLLDLAQTPKTSKPAHLLVIKIE
jgi:hypothetical protein